ncbi:hypothetical protein [Leclercia sp.]|uniref:hypothetical protein n=1 Tax=Leclercia sp. TaxID=1898428 RepID=UPI0028AADF9D|nr:hypothetical protein [Leclercia sp.]
MNITGNVVIGGVKPLDIETLLDLFATATKAEIKGEAVSVDADLIMMMTREIITLKAGISKSLVNKAELPLPENAFNYHGSPMNPLRYNHPCQSIKSSVGEDMKTPGLYTQLCGAS